MLVSSEAELNKINTSFKSKLRVNFDIQQLNFRSIVVNIRPVSHGSHVDLHSDIL